MIQKSKEKAGLNPPIFFRNLTDQATPELIAMIRSAVGPSTSTA